MPQDENFQSTPYDGHHSPFHAGNDWRDSFFSRMTGYGNFAGQDNRFGSDTADQAYIADRNNPQSKNYVKDFDPYLDQHLMSEKHNQAVDGVDAAAQEHDHGYFKHLKDPKGGPDRSMWSWDGMNAVRGDDRQLANRTQAEMDENGKKYSAESHLYTQAERGFFGGRADVMDGANFIGNKAGEVKNGFSNFISGAKKWDGVGDAASGIGHGLMDAGRWGANTLGQAASGVGKRAWEVAKLGPVGWLAEAGGLAQGAVAGGMKLGGMAKDALTPAWNGAKNLGSQAWNGAKSIGSSVASGVSSAASTVGTAISNGAGAVANGARAVGSTVANGVSHAASAVGGGAKAVGGAIAGGASKAWNWLTK